MDSALVNAFFTKLKNPLCLAGGGAANTAKVFTALGGTSAFAGSVGNDKNADIYIQDMKIEGVGNYLQHQVGNTGIFCALIQGDGTRTILVNSGVASALDSAQIPDQFFDANTILHIDGFLAANPERFEALVQRALEQGSRISFDIGGKGIAIKNLSLFKKIISDVSWVFMNEDEYCAISGRNVDDSLSDFSAETRATLIVKRAEVGAVCFSNGILVQSPVRRILPLDETGAGDAFAAGFLFAVLRSAGLPQCMRLANRAAEHVIQVPGMQFDRLVLQNIAAEIL